MTLDEVDDFSLGPIAVILSARRADEGAVSAVLTEVQGDVAVAGHGWV